MPTIHLTVFIKAPIERVFDLARSIDLHKKSMAHKGEEAVAGTTIGLIGLNESVTWKAKHLGKQRVFKSKITSFQKPSGFVDEMMDGDFKSFRHEHHFKVVDNGTLMIDFLHYEMPYGALGKLVDRLYLNKYLIRLLETRNEALKQSAETDKWKQFIK